MSASLSTYDLTTLAAIPGESLFPGQLCYVISLDVTYELKVTNSGGVAVANVTGMRWIASAPLSSVAHDATLTGDGSAGSPLSANVSTTTALAAPATDIEINIDGTLGDWEFSGTIMMPSSGTVSYYFQPNDDASNGVIDLVTNGSPAGVGALFVDGLTSAGAGALVDFVIRFKAAAGKQRGFYSSVADFNGTSTHRGITGIGRYTVTSGAITKVKFHSDTTNGFQAGTTITARPLGVSS